MYLNKKNHTFIKNNSKLKINFNKVIFVELITKFKIVNLSMTDFDCSSKLS